MKKTEIEKALEQILEIKKNAQLSGAEPSRIGAFNECIEVLKAFNSNLKNPHKTGK